MAHKAISVVVVQAEDRGQSIVESMSDERAGFRLRPEEVPFWDGGMTGKQRFPKGKTPILARRLGHCCFKRLDR
jgi:hypothetical protein